MRHRPFTARRLAQFKPAHTPQVGVYVALGKPFKGSALNLVQVIWGLTNLANAPIMNARERR